RRWSADHLSEDDPLLIEQIHQRLLPRRGVWARPEEILITVGAQQAIFLTSVLFGGPGNRIAVEDPCYPDARNIFQQFFGHVRPIPVDAQGIRVDQRLSGCQLLYTTPNRQYPLSVRMSPERREQLLSHAQRHGLIVIEDDYDGEADFDPRIPPALRSRAGGEQVIYLGTLSKSHNPGLRLGYMVASADFIAEARALRGMMIRHLPPFMQMAVAQFIHRGHHDALISRLQGVHEQRWRTTRDALERHFPDVDIHTGYGGTNFVIHADRPLDQARLRREALESGVVIEDISPCFSKPEEAERCLRLGVSAIGAKKIARGLRILRPIYERAQSR
ncbi:MAG: PLP-dependent aminotransferase family protein, partial [Gammaproteobacteria bacterium]